MALKILESSGISNYEQPDNCKGNIMMWVISQTPIECPPETILRRLKRNIILWSDSQTVKFSIESISWNC